MPIPVLQSHYLGVESSVGNPSILKVDALQKRWKRFSKSNSSSGD